MGGMPKWGAVDLGLGQVNEEITANHNNTSALQI